MNDTKRFELSNPQQRIWLTEVLNNHKDMSNIGYLLEFKGAYTLDLMVKAIKYVVKANDALQLRFEFSDTEKRELVQYIPEYEEIEVEIIKTATEEELLDQIETLHRKQFDISTSTHFCQFAVFSINNNRFGLFQKANHLVADGISAVNVAQEVLDVYKQLENNQLQEFKKEYSYLDFLEDEKEYIGSDKYEKNKNYWLERFEDFDGDEITFALNKNKKNSLKVERRSFEVPDHIRNLLGTYIAENRMSNFALFMAALAIYFNRFMNHDDIVIGMPVHNRNKKIFKKMVGMFVSTLPFRIKFEKNWNFNQLTAYIKKELWNALKNQAYPYNHLVKDLKDRDIDATDMLNVQLIELPGGNQEEVAKRAFYSTAYNISQLSIYLNQQNSKDLSELDIAVDYHVDIFSEREMEFFFKRIWVILEQAIKEPEKQISEHSFLDDSEYNELVTDLNQTTADFPSEKTIPLLFAEQVEKTPEAIALEYENQTVTYRQLAHLTDKLSAKLRKSGVGPDTIVGMLCERSLEAIISIFAIQKAGGAYVPIDPDYPADRKNYIIENSGIKNLLVEKFLEDREKELLETNVASGLNTIAVDYLSLKEEPEVDFISPDISSENLAYVIYTSGTTGNPKGTLLRHRNVINYIWWGSKVYCQGQSTTFPLFTSLSFDLTVTSIFIPLVTGNRLVIYRESDEGLLIEKVVKDNKVDIVKLTPSHLKVINQMKLDASRIRHFILGGEELKTETCRETLSRFGKELDIFNEYGPTETAVGCMIHRFDSSKDTGLAVPIGKPADNVRIYILDKNLNPLPKGIVGEIYIAGEGVARGYHNNDQLTSEKFIDNPFDPGKKMYRSGDLGRWNLDGILEFFGRRDEQVKIRGYRIELGEIEKHLMGIDGVKDAVVSLREGVQGELAAFLVGEDNQDLEVHFLREQLSRELPAYMLPAEFQQVESIPLTRNGKVDFKKLASIGTKLASGQEYVAPRDEMETMLSEIWAAVLGEERVGITDNFFEMGGDSIKAVQIAARLNDAGKSVNVKDILTHQTISAVCANVDFDSHIRKYNQETISGEKGITPIEGWFLSQNFANPNHFNQSVLLKFKSKVDTVVLQKVISRLIAHHDGLRLNYNKEKNCFVYNNSLLDQPFSIDEIDLSHLSEPEMNKQIEIKGYEIKGQLDIEKGPMMRAILFKTGNNGQQLLLTLHHLIVDGLTWRILLDHLFDFYQSYSQGNKPETPQKTASLLDWYDALIMYRDSGKLEDEKEYWSKIESVDFRLPYDAEPEKVDWSIEKRAAIETELEPNETEYLLKDAHETYKTDVQILVTTALVRTLRKWTGKQRVILEMENHGRHIEDIDTSKTTGWFTAIYPLLVDREDAQIGDEIKTVKEAIRKVPGKGIGFGILKYMTDAVNQTETKPSDIRFNYLGQFDQEVENALFSYSAQSTGSDIDLSNKMTAAIEMDAMIINDMFKVNIHFNSEAFTHQTIENFATNYINNLKEILAHIKGEDDVHFTPSDFDTVDLSEDDLAALFE